MGLTVFFNLINGRFDYVKHQNLNIPLTSNNPAVILLEFPDWTDMEITVILNKTTKTWRLKIRGYKSGSSTGLDGFKSSDQIQTDVAIPNTLWEDVLVDWVIRQLDETSGNYYVQGLGNITYQTKT